MFIAHLKDGRTFTEKDGTWDDLPDVGIASLHITLPFESRSVLDNGVERKLPQPTIELSNYDKYYFANEAVAFLMTIGGKMPQGHTPGQGIVIKQVMAGIDEKNNFVNYVEVDLRNGNIKLKRFPIEKLAVRKTALRKGS